MVGRTDGVAALAAAAAVVVGACVAAVVDGAAVLAVVEGTAVVDGFVAALVAGLWATAASADCVTAVVDVPACDASQPVMATMAAALAAPATCRALAAGCRRTGPLRCSMARILDRPPPGGLGTARGLRLGRPAARRPPEARAAAGGEGGGDASFCGVIEHVRLGARPS